MRTRFTFLILILCTSNVWAQQISPSAVPSSTDPSRIQERLSEPTAPGIEKVIPPEKKSFEAPPPLPEGKGIRLNKIVIDGATAFSVDAFTSYYADYLGKNVDLDIINYIAARITAHYHEAGFFLSRALVPQQSATNGVVHIQVMEGYISEIRLDDDALKMMKINDMARQINRFKERILSMKPLSGDVLNRQLLIFNDQGGINFSAVMEPLPKERALPGAVGMVLSVHKKSPSVSVRMDNYGSRYNGPLEASAYFSSGSNLIAWDELFLSSAISIPADEVDSISGGYSLPFGDDGARFSIGGGFSHSAPGYHLRLSEVKSDAYSFDTGISYPIIRSRFTNLKTAFTFDSKDISTDTLGVPLSLDRIRALRVSTQWNHTDALAGTTLMDATVSKGLDMLGARETGASNLSRTFGHSDFTKLTFNIGRLQQLGNFWQLYGNVMTQRAATSLLSSEQFGYGGQTIGRAYDPSELTGDHGVAGIIEARYNGIAPRGGFALQPFASYDAGKTWAMNSSVLAKKQAASAALGMRFFYNESIRGEALGAVPLSRLPEAPQNDAKNPRWLFQVVTQF